MLIRLSVLAMVFLVSCSGTINEPPVIDAGSPCDADPCERLACPVLADGGENTWVPNYETCTCSCLVDWKRQ